VAVVEVVVLAQEIPQVRHLHREIMVVLVLVQVLGLVLVVVVRVGQALQTAVELLEMVGMVEMEQHRLLAVLL
jgi:hypothetical protein